MIYQPLASLELPPVPPPAPPVVAQTKEPVEADVPGMPKILPRSMWAAQPPITPRLEPMGRITRITIHHEGMDTDVESSMSSVESQLRKIQRSHEERMHAGDIGYHYIIDSMGRIWEGRPIKYQGAHAGNGQANRGNIGVVLMGNFDIQRPSSAQLSSLKSLVAYLMAKYKVNVSGIYTHREIREKEGPGYTDCPGKYLQREVNNLRSRLASAQ
jgi:hypothetical protein